MMRFGLATHVLLAIGMVNGFVNHQPLVRTSRDVSLAAVGQGWDNENFLDSLSGGSDDMDAANQKYYKQAEQRGKLQEWRQQQQARHTGQELQAISEGASEESADADKEDVQGGSRFKEMMEKGKQPSPAATPEQRSGPILYNPMEGLTPSPKQTPGAGASSELSMQEQAQLFQKFLQMQQQGNVAPAPSPSKPGKRVGRNRDADTIANTADLYFAQLKRDSTVRTIARYEGDLERANAVFEDEGVKELEGMLQTNPYLKEAAKDSALLDTSADEMIAVMKLTAGNPADKDRPIKGPSYKEKLAEKKRRKQNGAAAEPPSTQANVPEPSKAKAEPTVPETMAQPMVAETKQSAAKAAPTPIQQQQSQPAVSRPEPVTMMGPGQPSVKAPPPNAPAVPPTVTDEKPEVRRGLRTLMGLILKHRGGPGFGKGRIKGDEAEGFEKLLGEITELLRSEATSSGAAEVTAATAQPAVPAPPAVPQPPQPKAVKPPVPQSVATPPPHQQMASTEQYIPAATTMSSSSSATYPAPGPPDQRLSKTIACVEGAVQMFKNSPPEIQEGLLLPMRGALMAAVHTCNQIIAENELENVQAYQDAVTQLPKPDSTPPTPGQFFEVKPYTPGGASGEDLASSEMMAPKSESANPAVSTPTGTDENSIFLQTVYDYLEAATGDEKFGLGKLTSAEAVALADKVVDMKVMLIEELDTGIPASTKEQNAETPSNGGAGSKYQQMLAKAKGTK